MTSVWCAQTLSWVGVIDPTHHEKHHHLYSTIPPSASKICASHPSANSDHIMYKVKYLIVTSRILLTGDNLHCSSNSLWSSWGEVHLIWRRYVFVLHCKVWALFTQECCYLSPVHRSVWKTSRFGDASSATRARTLNPSPSNCLTASHTRGKRVLPEITAPESSIGKLQTNDYILLPFRHLSNFCFSHQLFINHICEPSFDEMQWV